MEYVYPAVFEQNSDGSITITYPDLPGCISEGKTLGNAIYMAQNALTQWIEFLLEAKEPVPIPSDIKSIKPLNNQFINLVRTEIRNNRAIRRTVSIPMWLDIKASEAGVSLSKILQDALKEKLGV